METLAISLKLTVQNHLPVSAGGRGHGGVRLGHRQAQREVRHPPHHQQVHGELLPGERTCRCACWPVCWGYRSCLQSVSVFQSKSLRGFSLFCQVEMTSRPTASSTLVSLMFSGSAPWWSWRMLDSRNWGRWEHTVKILTGRSTQVVISDNQSSGEASAASISSKKVQKCLKRLKTKRLQRQNVEKLHLKVRQYSNKEEKKGMIINYNKMNESTQS